jgi:hypothetical protein
MKDRPSVFRMALAVITASAVYLGAPWTVASAQDTSSANVVPARPGPAAPLSYSVGEIVKMYQGGVSKDVIGNYIFGSGRPFHLDADGIIYLQTLGMPQELTKDMILRDSQLQQQQQASQQYYQQQLNPLHRW